MLTRSTWVVALWGCLIAISLAVIYFKLHVVSDISAFLPRAKNSHQQLLLHQIQRGTANRLLLIALEGGEQQQLIELSKQFAEELRALDGIKKVDNGQSAGASELVDWAMRYRYILSNQFDGALTPDELRQAFESRLGEIRSGLSALSTADIARDPTLQSVAVLQSWRPQFEPSRIGGIWVAEDKSRSLMVVETTLDGYDADAQADVVEAVQHLFRPYRDQGLILHLSGPATFAVASKNVIRADVQRFSIIASIALVCLLSFFYRSLVHALLVGLPMLIAVSAAISGTALIFPQVHGITLAFGVTVLGVTLDYPVHFFSHLRGRSANDAISGVWPTMRTGLITTLLGYLAFTLTEFDGLVQLALFSIIGLAAGGLATRFLLPALPEKLLSLQRAPEHSRTIVLPRYTVVFAIACAAVIGILAFKVDKPWLEKQLTAVGIIPESSLALDKSLRGDLHVPGTSELVVVTGDSAQAVLEKQESLHESLEQWRNEAVIGGYDMASRYLPSLQRQHQRRARIPESAELEKLVDNALNGLPLRASAFTPFTDGLSSARTDELLDYSAGMESPLADRLASLLFQLENRWIGIVTLSKVSQQNLPTLIKGLEMPQVEYVSLAETSAGMLTEYVEATVLQLGWVVVIIALVLLMSLRDIRRVTTILLIAALALSTDVFVLHLLGERLSVFHLVALMLVLGIGLDYALFFTRPGFSNDTFHALMVCCVSTVLVFGLLAFSSVPLIQAIGATTALGVLLCFVYGGIFSLRKTQ